MAATVCDNFNMLNISTLKFIGNLSVCVHCVFYFPCLPLIYSFTGIKQCNVTEKKQEEGPHWAFRSREAPSPQSGPLPHKPTYWINTDAATLAIFQIPLRRSKRATSLTGKTRGVSWSSSLEKQSLGQNGGRCSWGVGEGQRAVGRVSWEDSPQDVLLGLPKVA